MQNGCSLSGIWRVLACAGAVGVATAAWAVEPPSTTDTAPRMDAGGKVVPVKTERKPQIEKPVDGRVPKAPPVLTGGPVLRGPGQPNDNCIDAEFIPSIPAMVAGNTSGANGSPEGGACSGAGLGTPGVWYRFNGTGNSVIVETCGLASWDTVLRSFTGTCAGLSCVAYNDDACDGLRSRIQFGTTAGVEYHIYISGYSAAANGPFSLNIMELGPPPSNDDCVNAELITIPGLVSGTTLGANPSSEAGACAGAGMTSPGVWYRFAGTGDTVRIETCGLASWDTIIRGFTGNCFGLMCEAINDQFCGNQSRIQFTTTAGADHYVYVSGWISEAGPFSMDITVVPPPGPGDSCATALPAAVPGSVSGDTSTNQPDSGLVFCGPGAASNSAWFQITGPGGVVRASLCAGAAWDTVLAVYTGPCGALSCVASDDDFCSSFGPSQVAFGTNAGQTYFLVVRGWSASDMGPFTLDLQLVAAPTNDNCADAIHVNVPSMTAGSTIGATPSFEAGACAGAGLASAGVWYHLLGTGNDVRVETCGLAPWDTVLRAFGGNCGFLICEAYNDDSCGLQSRIQFSTILGAEYLIYISAYGAATTGEFTLNIQDVPPPGPGDSCSTAFSATVPGTVSGDTSMHQPDFGVPFCGANAGSGSPSVWYQITGTGGVIRASLCAGTSWDTVLAVFTGSCGALTCVGSDDDFCFFFGPSQVAFASNLGQTYWVVVRGYAAADVGPYSMTLEEVPAPPNNECAGAIGVAVPSTTSGTTEGGTPSLDASGCAGPGLGSPGVWYSFTGTGEMIEVSTCGLASWDTVLRAFSGDCSFLICEAVNDDACASLQSRIRFPSTAGVIYFIYISGFGAASGPFDLSVTEFIPCTVHPGPNAQVEEEPNCGLPDSVNGGCNSSPNVFGSIACGIPIYGSGAFDGGTRDTDWYQFTLTDTETVTVTLAAEFAALFGLVETNTPNPMGLCSEITGFVNPAGFTSDDCLEYSVVATLGAGTWTVFVAPVFGDTIACGAPNSHYLVTLTFASGCGGFSDCNGNGIDDAVEIAGDASLDCFNPAVVQTPHAIGGPDGIIDACQCPANWDRNGAVNSTDISAYITSWLSDIASNSGIADINCSGSTNSTDISAKITIWLSAINNTVPYDNCP